RRAKPEEAPTRRAGDTERSGVAPEWAIPGSTPRSTWLPSSSARGCTATSADEVGVEAFDALRTEPVGEVGSRVLGDELFDAGPVTGVVADALAGSADGDDTGE